MNKSVLGSIAASIVLCLAPYAHADTIKGSDLFASQLTPNGTTDILFDASSQPRTPTNPTSSTLIVPVAVGPGLDLKGAIDNDDRAEISANALSNNLPTSQIGGGVSSTVLTSVALGLIPQPQESDPSVPGSAAPLPPGALLFGTALVGLLLVRRRRVIGL